MNTNSFRRSLLIGTVALMAGMVLSLVMGGMFPKVASFQIENRGAGHNHVAISHVTEATQPKD